MTKNKKEEDILIQQHLGAIAYLKILAKKSRSWQVALQDRIEVLRELGVTVSIDDGPTASNSQNPENKRYPRKLW